MHFPKGFKGPKGKVLRLLRAVYGLPESMRIFVDHLGVILLKMGFKRSTADPAVFILARGKSFIWIPVFVDDMFIMENNPTLYEKIMSDLKKAFTLNDLGMLRYALGIRFNIDIPNGIIEMDQQAQKERLLELSGLEESKSYKTPLPKGMVLDRSDEEASPEDEKELKDFGYRTKTGKIGYLVAGYCPDLAYGFTQVA